MEATETPELAPADRPEELSEEERHDPRFVAAREAGQGEKGRELLEHAAQGAKLDEREEKAGLDWLLGPPQRVGHAIWTDYETPAGLVRLTFVTRAMDTRKIDEIEQRNVNQATGSIDRLTADCEIVAAATVHIEDSTGRQVEVNTEDFCQMELPDRHGEVRAVRIASPALALERRFATQLGVVSGVALQIKRASGYDPDRVGSAQRRLVEASLG